MLLFKFNGKKKNKMNLSLCAWFIFNWTKLW